MKRLRTFVRDDQGATAAEFAMVLPLVILLLFAIIDVGRFAWAVNRAEKATQVGARWAAVTDLVPSGLATYSFAASGGIPQGTPVPVTAFPGLSCQSNGSAVSCACAAGGSCAFATTANATTFRAIAARMKTIKPDIGEVNVVVNYRNSGLGYAGDPSGPDVAPIINVRLQGMTFRPLSLLVFGVDHLDLPTFSYSLTMEDGQGTVGYY
ncbi:MAG: TadE family protein [Pseudomonadota bacterium]